MAGESRRRVQSVVDLIIYFERQQARIEFKRKTRGVCLRGHARGPDKIGKSSRERRSECSSHEIPVTMQQFEPVMDIISDKHP